MPVPDVPPYAKITTSGARRSVQNGNRPRFTKGEINNSATIIRSQNTICHCLECPLFLFTRQRINWPALEREARRVFPFALRGPLEFFWGRVQVCTYETAEWQVYHLCLQDCMANILAISDKTNFMLDAVESMRAVLQTMPDAFDGPDEELPFTAGRTKRFENLCSACGLPRDRDLDVAGPYRLLDEGSVNRHSPTTPAPPDLVIDVPVPQLEIGQPQPIR